MDRRRDAPFPLLDLPLETVELALGSVLGLEDRRALRLACKKSRAIIDRSVTKVERASKHVSGRELSTPLRAPWRLQTLHLTGGGLGPVAAAALAAAAWPRLAELALDNNSIGCAGAAQLAAGQWPALERLSLVDSGVGTVGAASLAAGHWPRLQGFSLAENSVGSAGAAALAAASKRWTALLDLELSNNGIGAGGVAALAAGD